ncbi:hypothetical protein BDY19DRAFT_933976 [Irpex rosettiformis]|uniref:Uncharacterized protein n=1 Tax=Irpex rosettiformis TaxID=378272 RepID=A0ACB8UA57_9APHY|nr:hypothetical protein BDY19DRAFT_933976 [Irpex rosettiformis]
MATAHTLVSPYPPHPQSQPNNVQSMTGDFRLPSIKDLNFPTQPPPQDGTPAQNSSDHGSLQSAHQVRHQHPGWSRNAQATNNASSQHASTMPPPPDPVKTAHKSTRKQSDGGYAPASMHYPSDSSQGANGAVAGHARSNPPPHPSSKRGRSSSSVGAPPGRSPHPNTPTHPHPQQTPHPPPSYHSAPPPQTQGSPEQSHQASGYPPPNPPYGYPTQMPPRGYPVQPPTAQPPAHQHQHQPPPSNSYPPPPTPHEHWQHPTAPPPGQSPYGDYIRTTPIVPATVEPRSAPPQSAAEPERGTKDTIINEIVQHCNTLWSFANQYAQSQPQYQPPPDDLRKMTHFASTVVRLLEELKRLTSPDAHVPQSSYSDDARAPKRPWEDMSREEEMPGPSSESTAEQDMEIIRSKRATSSGANTPGQPKSKYRKRSRATPPGKCHSCNIRETPEWRRGPDGARTLCNACGLHYAKLMRKREKILGADGKPMPIDLQTLRASTASARGSGAEGGEHHTAQGPPGQGPPHHGGQPPPYDPAQQAMHPPPPHGSPYQLIPVSAQNQPPPPPHGAHPMMPPPPPPQNQEHSIPGPVPPPPWANTNRYPPDQSYIRPPPHARSPQ